MTDTSGPTSYAPFARWDRDSQSWRTSEATSLWDLELSSLTLPAWGGLQGGELCEHPTPVRLTNALDSSSLPTPVADHSRGLPSSTTDYASLANVAVTFLPTPAVNDMGEGKTLEWWDDWAPRQKAADGRPAPHGRSLAIEAQRLLPTPRSTDGTDAPANLTPSVQAICDGSAGRTPRLSEMAVGNLLPTPKATNNENRQSLDRYGMNLGMALQSLGETTALPSPDGSASSDDQHQHQLSLDGLALPA